MINIKDTERYNINPANLIGEAFETAYTRYAEEQPIAPPDITMPIFTGISMALLCILFILTGIEYSSEKLTWFALAIVCVAFGAYSAAKYIKKNKQYRSAAGKPSTIKAKRERFFSLFRKDGEEFPESILAGDMLKTVSPIIGKQNDQVNNNAIREISEELARINNPSHTICKLVNPCGERFDQAKRRLYFKEENGKFIFFDSDWMKPKGEIVCEEDDIVSFGAFSKYSGINPSGGKIRQDAIIVEAQDSDHHIYFEFQNDSLPQLKKAFSSKKEKK
ncbi:MAG: hypothetical protein ACLSVG_05820 [Clostridia bacterium]